MEDCSLADKKSKEEVLDFGGVKPFEPMNSKAMVLAAVTGCERAAGPKGPMSNVEFTITSPDEIAVEEWIEDAEAEGGYVKGDGIVMVDDDNAKMTKAKGRKLYRSYSHTPDALPFLYEFVKAAKPGTDLTGKFKMVEKDFIGVVLALKFKNEAYEEQIRGKPSKCLPAAAFKA
jgi:hypothetical protein